MAKTEDVHEWFFEYLPNRPLLMLDVGAGSGRDAAFFSSLGHDVIAVEPSAGMRAEAAKHHSSSKIQWIDDIDVVHSLRESDDSIIAHRNP